MGIISKLLGFEGDFGALDEGLHRDYRVVGKQKVSF